MERPKSNICILLPVIHRKRLVFIPVSLGQIGRRDLLAFLDHAVVSPPCGNQGAERSWF
jgi:hypothetical protein